MPRVNIPNLGTVNFPDSMSPADIEHEAGKLYLSYAGNLPGIKPRNFAATPMEQSALGGLYGGPTGNAPDSTLAAPRTQSLEQAKADPMTGAVIAGGAAGFLAEPLAGPVVQRGIAALGTAAINPKTREGAMWLLNRALASEAINQGRKIPYVGPLIPLGAEAYPFFVGGGGLRGAAQAAAPIAAMEAAPYVESQVARGATAASEAMRERMIAQSPELGRLATAAERPMGPIRGPGPQPRTPTPSPTSPPPSAEPSFPPPATRTQFDIKGNAFQDVQEDVGIQQSMRESLEAHGRNAAIEEARIRRAASTVDVPKSTLVEQARAGTVTYTNTPPPATKSAAVTPKSRAEGMRLMKESIKIINRRKGRIQ